MPADSLSEPEKLASTLSELVMKYFEAVVSLNALNGAAAVPDHDEGLALEVPADIAAGLEQARSSLRRLAGWYRGQAQALWDAAPEHHGNLGAAGLGFVESARGLSFAGIVEASRGEFCGEFCELVPGCYSIPDGYDDAIGRAQEP